MTANPTADRTAKTPEQGQVPSIPRAQWETHPHYPEQVLLLGSHENFRHISARLVDSAERGEPVTQIDGLYRRWIAAMRSHESYEEYKLYPFLARRWGACFEAASEGHDALHRRDRDVRAALLRHEELPDALPPGQGVDNEPPADQRLLQALVAHDQTLNAHLRLEEELVIPLLLSLSPSEFSTYWHS